MSTPIAATDAAARRRLFAVSFLILFLELACIRWFGSTVIFLTFFTNIVLMACFLGMAVGLLSSGNTRRGFDFSKSSLMILAFTCVLAWMSLTFYQSFTRISVDVGGQASPQQIFFGTEYRANDPSRIVIPIEAIAGTFFLLIALVFVGPGQIMGRAFNAVGDRVRAYTCDIAGSLCGIAAFGLCSYFQTPPIVWFSIALAIYFWTQREDTHSRGAPNKAQSRVITQSLQAAAAVLILFFVWRPENFARRDVETFWSPYYKINYLPRPDYAIQTNNIGHQSMQRVALRGSAYALPYLLNRDAGKKPFGDVLIIGAGSGNDVQAARWFNATTIDAVEIDPVIQALGQRDHPDRPYDDPRVTRHNDDGRAFVKRTNKKYDLIVYALVDSLVLHSGYSSLRLESFLFTRQALQDIKARLKPGGVFAMYNVYRQGWVVVRLAKVAEEVFGRKPVVMALPYKAQIRAEDAQPGSSTFILCGDTQAIENAFARNKSFWLNTVPAFNQPVQAYGQRPPQELPIELQPLMPLNPKWQRLGPTQITTSSPALLPDDDWPFLYLRERAIPALNARGILLIGVLSLLLLWLFGTRSWSDAAWSTPGRIAPGRSTPDGTDAAIAPAATKEKKFNWQMLFLGAGFMLLETKSVVHMALLFGSTWLVNSFVFAAVLVMILAANLLVAKSRPRSLTLFYVLLALSLLLGLLVPMNTFLALPGAARILASCAVTFAPIFFAGVIFSSAFAGSRKPDVDFGCNVAGIILGGLCENLSLAVGFNGLLGIALAFYALAFAFTRKTQTREVENLEVEPSAIQIIKTQSAS